MKRCIKCTTVTNDAIWEAERFANQYKHSIIDLQNHSIIVPLGTGSRESDLMSPTGWGKYLQNLGFNVSLKRGDFEYETQDNRSCGFTDFNKRYLRNRLIVSITW